ncbi:MAG: hypothetical protein NTZ51_08100 [Proteobacteria bacterium]|nr:hypothetical protein [Pseudomonadota bacterium]
MAKITVEDLKQGEEVVLSKPFPDSGQEQGVQNRRRDHEGADNITIEKITSLKVRITNLRKILGMLF